MRSEPTIAERVLWTELRANKLGGFKFRRQHSLGNYIADFVCLAQRLVIEVDGDSHEGRDLQDSKRSEYIEKVGFSIMRFTNGEVLEALDNVTAAISLRLGIGPQVVDPTLSRPSPALPSVRKG